MNKLSIVTILFLSIIIAGCSNVDSIQKESTKAGEAVETDHEEYTIDSNDFYSVDPTETGSFTDALTKEEERWLIHMREEEKLARDVYTTLGERWQTRIFTNIASSEQTHTDSIKTLIDRYGIEDPVKDEEVGEFTLPEIKALYNDLVRKGSNSLSDALVVGATIEDLDISDLDKAINETNKTDIVTVYKNLQKGSRNHMRAFVKQIEKQEIEYNPQYISSDTYLSIISSPQEKGRIK